MQTWTAPHLDVDVDGVYERMPRPLCPPHLITLQFNYIAKILHINTRYNFRNETTATLLYSAKV